MSLLTGETGGLFVQDYEKSQMQGVMTTSIAAGNGQEVHADAKCHGEKGLKLTFGGSNAGNYAYASMGDVAELFIRFFFLVPASFDLGADGTVNFGLLLDGSAASLVIGNLTRSGTDWSVRTQWGAWGGWANAGAAVAISKGTWYRWDAHFLKDAAAGGGEAWLDGVSMGSKFDVDTSGITIGQVMIGNWAANPIPDAGSELWYDDVAGDIAYIGDWEGDPGRRKLIVMD